MLQYLTSFDPVFVVNNIDFAPYYCLACYNVEGAVPNGDV